jgi:hypothetical protein
MTKRSGTVETPVFGRDESADRRFSEGIVLRLKDRSKSPNIFAINRKSQRLSGNTDAKASLPTSSNN